MNGDIFKIYECLNCGEILGHVGNFCSDECAREYHYTNRTCGNCGGEFWDGGTSCTCEDFEEEEHEPSHRIKQDYNETEDLPF